MDKNKKRDLFKIQNKYRQRTKIEREKKINMK